MTTWIKRITVLLLVSSASFISACGGGHDEADVVGVAGSTRELSILTEAIEAAGLTRTLQGTGPFTVFAPSDQAFAALLTELGLSKAQLLSDKPLLTSVLKYHVFDGNLPSTAIALGVPLANVQAGFITAAASGGSLALTDGRGRVSNVTRANLSASNGVVHLIDKVLLPSDKNTVTVASNNPDLSILVEALEEADLVTTLQGTGPFTVFAPTNQAFADLLTELNLSKAQLLANKTLLSAVLKTHVISGNLPSPKVPLGLPITTVESGYIKATASGNTLTLTDGRNRLSTVTGANVQTSNGVVHVVNKVLLPANQTVAGTAVALSTAATPEFTVLVEALSTADLVSTLNGPGPFTVFAPTDAAFTALLSEKGLTKAQLLADKAFLTKVLTYHVVPGLVLKAQVPVGRAIKTVQGETFTVNAALTITDRQSRSARITGTDVLASNGVIHVIDKVILPAN
jgi:uncharacterized surface protein with fasciclin (FAS1) repeats